MKEKQKTSIIMYHFVRNLKHSMFPQIKGLDIRDFREQIAYLKKHYQFIRMEDLILSIEEDYPLPKKAVLLTFDDAYVDHYVHVFPILQENNIQGSFFPPAKAIIDHSVLDVNKIHFILASGEKTKIIAAVYEQLDRYRNEFNLSSNHYYYRKLAQPGRFDGPEIVFIKRLLQKELKEGLRNIIVDKLFQDMVTNDEESFSRELYMNIDQIKCMKHNGMHIGSHGYKHYWLNTLTKSKQMEEVQKSCDFLNTIGVDSKNRTICYPYGGYNQSLIRILKKHDIKLGLTTRVNIAEVSKKSRYELPRLDTNDIPKNSKAKVNNWFTKG